MQDITALLMIAMSLLSLLLTMFIIPFLRSKLSAQELDELAYWVNVAVEAVEQTSTGKGAEKKAAVLAFLEARGITYDTEALDAMIEAAVHSLTQKYGVQMAGQWGEKQLNILQ